MKNRHPKTATFVGYRTCELLSEHRDENLLEKISINLDSIIESLINEGYTTFFTGISEGFSLYAALVVLSHKQKHPAIRLIVVVPKTGQKHAFDEYYEYVYYSVLMKADECVALKLSLLDNLSWNDFLFSKSTCAVCYYDDVPEGVMCTMDMSADRENPVVSVYMSSSENEKKLSHNAVLDYFKILMKERISHFNC